MILLKYMLIFIGVYIYGGGLLNAHNPQHLGGQYKTNYKYRKTVPVKGYFKKNGTYVPRYWRSPRRRR